MSDLDLPPDYPVVPTHVYSDIEIVKLAREIAMGIHPIEQILQNNSVSTQEFARIQRLPRFISVLEAEIASWHSAINTNQRVRVKAAAMMEEWLPELYKRINDQKESLMHKVKAGELVARLGEMGLPPDKAAMGAQADRVNITINLGNDTKLDFQKTIPEKVIEHDPQEPLFTASENING